MTNDEYKEADAVFWEAYQRFQGAMAAEFGVTESSEQAAIVITNKLAAVRAEYAPIVKAAEAVDGFLHLPNNSWATDVYPEGHQALDDLHAALADLKK